MTRLVLLCVTIMSLCVYTVAQHPTKCDPKNAPLILPSTGENGSSRSCCQAGRELFEVGPHGMAHREVGRPCSMNDHTSSTHCAIGAGTTGPHPLPVCDFGACGALIVEVIPSVLADTVIFKPTSKPQVCGYQTKDPVSGAVSSFPEPYTNQHQYAGVTAACPYTACLVGGRPATTFTLTAVADHAAGRVKTNPPGITISGAGTDSKEFATAVTFIADPHGEHARAVFSGACIKTGEYGHTAVCSTQLVPNPDVTVTYECHAGFTCLGPH